MLLALVLAQAISIGNPRGPIFNQPSLMSNLAQFEAFNLVSTDWCAGTAITGARGEALTGTRATPATCTKGVDGLRSTNIADGDLVSLGVNVMRAEADADGYLGLLVEGAASPITIQSRPICNAAWADVGTPACAADITTGPWGTQTMGRLTDDDGAAKEGRSQTMATTSATRFTAYCYVKGGTALEASLTLAGTGNAAGDCAATLTGLSTTTSSVIECTSAVAYTGAVTAVTVSVLAGDAVGDTGTLYVEGCNVVPSATYRTSFTDAAAVTVARGVESAAFNGLSISSANGLSWSANVQHPSANGGSIWGAGPALVTDATNRTQVYRANTNVQVCDYISTGGNRTTGTVIAAYVAGQSYRQGCSYSGPGAASTLSSYRDSTLITTSAAGATSVWTAVTVIPGALGAAATTIPSDSIITRLKVDTSPLGGL